MYISTKIEKKGKKYSKSVDKKGILEYNINANRELAYANHVFEELSGDYYELT
jgi:hypothetical protein